MKLNAVKILLGVAVLFFLIFTPRALRAQNAATLSGAVRNSSGEAVANAKVSVRNTKTGQEIEARTSSDGIYSVPNLMPGEYDVSASAEGLSAQAAHVTLTGASQQGINLILRSTAQQENPPGKSTTAPAANLPNAPNAPSGSATAPSMQDLGFTPEQTQGNAQLQAMLDKRSHMLKVHQRLGLITAIPMVATVITGPQAKAKGRHGEPIKEPTAANLDFHIALGGATTALYGATAYYAMFAPKVPGTQKRGAIRMHEALAWVHGPGMILTPVLGIMAYKQENSGEKVHGIAAAHGAVAYTTAIAYGASIVAVSWPIHWKFWEAR